MVREKIVLTTEDIDQDYDESKSTQAKRRMRGIGPPFVKRGNRVLTFKEDYEAWLQSLKRQSTSQTSAK